jgi:hypothetical protein
MPLIRSAAPRALAHFKGATAPVAAGWLLCGGLLAYLFTQNIAIFQFWSMLFAALTEAAGVPSQVAVSHTGVLLVNVVTNTALPPVTQSATGAALLAAALFGLSFVPRTENVPARYALRAASLVLGVPGVGYLLAGGAPPLDIARHLSQVFQTGYWFVLLAPVLYALTAFVLPGNVARRMGYVLVAIAYLVLTVPMLALLHLVVLTTAGIAWLPLLNIGFTVLVLSFEFIAFYGLIASVD